MLSQQNWGFRCLHKIALTSWESFQVGTPRDCRDSVVVNLNRRKVPLTRSARQNSNPYHYKDVAAVQN